MKYKILLGPESIQGSKEWLDFRKGKISASMAPTIMGENPYTSALQLWEEIVNDKPKEKNEAMARGNRLEPKARAWVNETLGVNYEPAVVQSVAHPDFIASLDGLYFDERGKAHILEIKCPRADIHLDALQGNYPFYYAAQMQHQMDIMGLDEMKYCSFDGEKGVILTIRKNEEYGKLLLAEETAFLASLINFKPPEPTDRDWVTIDDPSLNETLSRLAEINHTISCLETEKEELRKQFIFDHPRVKIGEYKIQRVTRQGAINYSAIPELEGVDLAKYRKAPITSLRIS